MPRAEMPSVEGAAPAAPRTDMINLYEIVLALRSHLKLILGIGILAFVASLAYVLMATPLYQGQSQVLLESRENAFTRPVEQTGGDVTAQVIDEQAVASQVAVIRSREVAAEVARRLELVGNPEFDPRMRPMNPIQRITSILGGGSDAEADEAAAIDRVLDTYYDRLLVYAVGRSRVIAIEFQASDPHFAARAANVIAEVYLETLEAAKIDAARTASAWLSQNIDRLRERVREAEARVEAFRSGTGLLVGGDNATLTSQQLGDLSTQLGEARSLQADSEARATLIRELIEAGRAFEIPDVAADELIRALVQERVTLRAQIAAESRTLLDRHPRIVALQAQLADLDAQIRGAAERIVRTLENEARLAAGRVSTLTAALDRQMQVASRANENEVQLRALEREARAEREQLEVFLARYRDAVARDSEEAAVPDARIVSRAAAPQDPIWPRTVPVVFLFTAAAVTLAAGAVVMKAIVFDMFRPAMAVAPAPMPVSAPVLGAGEAPVPPPSGGGGGGGGGKTPERPAAGRGDAEGFDIAALAARLQRIVPSDRGRRVAVTGLAGYGNVRDGLASTLATRLGEALVAPGAPTLLVELAPTDGVEDAQAAAGFSDLVAGEASFFEAIDRLGAGRPHRVGAGTGSADPLAPEQEEGLEIALAAFDETYTATIFVLPDPHRPGALGALAPRMDAVVIAAEVEPDDADLVELYDAAKAAGAPDVVVAIAPRGREATSDVTQAA
ncbi:LPS biosynthesis protein [Salinarimonas ramus]|uniref:LPS biosynthesis protein n=2 Tax=Salinarimonas ramus TaxID=690164 RepID=A0A917V6H4_9HYPH|nr:LPS biosynthesis protein [Salinarimonas ramus]